MVVHDEAVFHHGWDIWWGQHIRQITINIILTTVIFRIFSGRDFKILFVLLIIVLKVCKSFPDDERVVIFMCRFLCIVAISLFYKTKKTNV